MDQVSYHCEFTPQFNVVSYDLQGGAGLPGFSGEKGEEGNRGYEVSMFIEC